ncbi:hypothetical protein [Yinghuangia seranimata]|uniref:hypothetical protein n=1 Tax=Yinghuangia seranimata TaxID=408067 RepID=UPI00248BB6CF|nr:hypothetical protein [Yinghuangia seranimata]MDI2126067.1 hypothetical protein [Yinghuangia seranimata]
MRRATTLVRLLLFALLVLGTAGMHTLGHPPESGPSHDPMAGTTVTVSMADPVADPMADPAADCPDGHCAADAASGVTFIPATAHGSGLPMPHGGMDPASLCMAVLLAAVTLAITLFLLRPCSRRRARLTARGLWGRATSALPPPTPPDLSCLAVLRI